MLDTAAQDLASNVMCNLRAAVSACVRALLSGSHCTYCFVLCIFFWAN